MFPSTKSEQNSQDRFPVRKFSVSDRPDDNESITKSPITEAKPKLSTIQKIKRSLWARKEFFQLQEALQSIFDGLARESALIQSLREQI